MLNRHSFNTRLNERKPHELAKFTLRELFFRLGIVNKVIREAEADMDPRLYSSGLIYQKEHLQDELNRRLKKGENYG